jgi:hypothetical protein
MDQIEPYGTLKPLKQHADSKSVFNPMLGTRIVSGRAHVSANGMQADIWMNVSPHIHEWNCNMDRMPVAGKTIQIRICEQAIAVRLVIREKVRWM